MELSNCRYCNCLLDGGEILNTLAHHPDYADYTQEKLEQAARSYGWTPDNHKCFRRDIIIQFINKPQIEICPDCNGVWPRSPNMPKSVYKPPAKSR